MATSLLAAVAVVFATVIGAFGSLYLKLGAEKLTRKVSGLFVNYKLYFGVFLYGVSAVIFIIALKFGELSVLYPLVAMTYIWVNILSVKLLKEKMNRWKWLGVVLIVVGVGFIGLGSG